MTAREILKSHGYRRDPVAGGWTCSDCKWCYEGSSYLRCRHPQIADAAVGRHNVCDLFAPDRSQPSPLSDVRPGSRPWAPPLPVDFADRQYEGRTDGEW